MGANFLRLFPPIVILPGETSRSFRTDESLRCYRMTLSMGPLPGILLNPPVDPKRHVRTPNSAPPESQASNTSLRLRSKGSLTYLQSDRASLQNQYDIVINLTLKLIPILSSPGFLLRWNERPLCWGFV
jgi:hypothetical protein